MTAVPPSGTPAAPATSPATSPSRSAASGVILQVGLWIIVAAILTQATLAGLFLSGVGGARFTHLMVGWLLPFVAIAVAVAAGIAHTRRSCRPGIAIATYPLPVLLWVQEVLGHVPAAASTAIHVPFGVGLAVYTTTLALLARKRGGRTGCGVRDIGTGMAGASPARDRAADSDVR